VVRGSPLTEVLQPVEVLQDNGHPKNSKVKEIAEEYNVIGILFQTLNKNGSYRIIDIEVDIVQALTNDEEEFIKYTVDRFVVLV